jgi:hypothetical protein
LFTILDFWQGITYNNTKLLGKIKNLYSENGVDGGDLVITGGKSHLVSGFEPNDNTHAIEFSAEDWEQNKKVPVDMVMTADKVYGISIPAEILDQSQSARN